MKCPLCDKPVENIMGHLTWGHNSMDLAQYIVMRKKAKTDYGIFEGK